jgi:hypothetical protein
MLLPFFLALTPVAGPAVTITCPADRAIYSAAGEPTSTAKLSLEGDVANLLFTEARLGRRYRFALDSQAGRRGLAMRLLDTESRDGATSRYKASDFKVDRVFFFTSAMTVVEGVPGGAAPPYFYPANFYGDLYYAGTVEPGKERSFITPGLFILSGCEGS